jgi:hypothetical protein
MAIEKHTPGPWTQSAVNPLQIIGPGAVRIAEANCYGEAVLLNRNEAEANARLIAAAPELLAALKRALNHVIMDGVHQTDAPAARKQIEAAIAKVQGE